MREFQDLDHANYFRAGGVHQDLPSQLEEDILKFCDSFPKLLMI